MKNRIVSKTSSAILLAAALAGPAITASAQSVISWNVDSWSTVSYLGEYAGATAEYAGVVSATYWNSSYYSATGNPTGQTPVWANLLNNAGSATSMSVSSTSFTNGWNYISVLGNLGAQTDANNYLLNGYNNKGSSEAPGLSTVSLSSIPYAQYDLYVYFTSDTAGRAGTVNVGATTYDFSTLAGTAIHSGGTADLIQTTDTTGANPGADYAVFSGLTGNSQTINVSVPAWGGISGFQIVAVPEPGTLALAGLSGIGMLAFGRRFKARH